MKTRIYFRRVREVRFPVWAHTGTRRKYLTRQGKEKKTGPRPPKTHGTLPEKEAYTYYDIKLARATDADQFWKEFAKDSVAENYRPARVALIIGCQKQPGTSLLDPSGMATSSANEAESCFFTWLGLELPGASPEAATELFRATIAGTSEDTVLVHCDKPNFVTLVFARFDSESNALESATKSVKAAFRAVASNGQRYRRAYVSTKSFVEHVADPSFPREFESIDLQSIMQNFWRI